MNAKLAAGIIIAVIAIALLGLYFQGMPTGQVALAANQETITIGAIGPLTGSAASIGRNSEAAIELAVEEINAKGGINGKKLKIMVEDGQCDAMASSTAAKKLVEVDNVPAIVGGMCSAETMAAAPIAEAGSTVLLSNCSSNPAITEAGDYIFRIYPSDNFQGKISAEFAFNELGAKKAAILSCQSDWCTGLKEVFSRRFPELGGTIAAEEEFAQGTNDMRTQLLKIKKANPDVIYFLAYEEEAISGIKQAKELGIETQLLGGDSFAGQVIWDAVGNAGEGIMYTAPTVALTKEFKDAMLQKTGSEEITTCAPQAYDAVYLIADALRTCGENSKCIKEELYKVQGYSGVSGKIGFDKKGDLATAEYAIMKVENGKAVEYGG
jgi:branched-chain amino acid transport system substrate-binding protein